MSKICFMSYYGPIETLGFAERSLIGKGYTVLDFPLYKCMNENRDSYVEDIVYFIQDNDVQYVLWWYINIPTDDFKQIKDCTKVKYILFNWDEPFNWSSCDIPNKMTYIDYAFVTCQETIETYRDNGCNAHCLYAGFDPETNYLIKDIDMIDYNRYCCDISFCCTNLYDNNDDFPDQYINRKELIDKVYHGQDSYGYVFHIYGPETLKDMYPKSYRGFANYFDLNKIFNYSKINLCTHVLCNRYGYLNERVILIGASGGLVLVDHVKGIEEIFSTEKHILIIDRDDYLQQISNILNEYDRYIKFRRKFNELCQNSYCYSQWAEKIDRVLKEDISC